MMRERIILTDADGVLLNWNEGFNDFMTSKGYEMNPEFGDSYLLSDRYGITPHQAHEFVRFFNESPMVENLHPFADSVKYVNKFADLGFRFIVVTSLSDSPWAKHYRTKNLIDIFGPVFEEIVCLKMGISKYNELCRWDQTGYFWIEDHTRQAEAGYEAGLKPVLIDHPYNSHFQTDLFPRVSYDKPWEEIYEMVCKDYGLL
jgi:hypothetical protein